MHASTFLITGCSTGFGRELASQALQYGHRVIVTARDTGSLDEFVARWPEQAFVLELDVTSDESVRAAVSAGLERFGAIDVVINNAGYGIGGAVEEAARDEIDQLFETDFYGVVRVVQAVLPSMRQYGSGTIVNISSTATRAMAAGGGFYSAVKSAVLGLSGSLRKEVAPFGIGVVTVQPSSFETDFHGRSLKMQAGRIAAYDQMMGRDSDTPRFGKAADPAEGARAILEMLAMGDVPEIFLVGAQAVDNFRKHAEREQRDVDRFEELSRSASRHR